MSNLIVLAGKPGVGKSTLINQAFPNLQVVDVLSFLKNFKLNGSVPEERTAEAYDAMYKYLNSELNISSSLVIELGTNHVQKNIEKLEHLSKKHSVFLFLCVAPTDICRKRALERNRPIEIKALELRLARPFPDTYLDGLKDSALQFKILNMEDPLETNTKLLRSLLPVG